MVLAEDLQELLVEGSICRTDPTASHIAWTLVGLYDEEEIVDRERLARDVVPFLLGDRRSELANTPLAIYLQTTFEERLLLASRVRRLLLGTPLI